MALVARWTSTLAALDRTVGVLLAKVAMTGPTPVQLMRRFWQYAFAA